MSFSLKNVIPWGRSFEEYCAMFDLTNEELKLRILGCGDGPASFNSVLTKRGGSIASIDPLYQFTTADINRKIKDACNEVLKQMEQNKDDYVWDTIKSISQLVEIRMSAMNEFLSDFESGKQQKRYIAGELPHVPFENESFDLALCSHFLFLFSDTFSLEFHYESIKEMCRVANEVRIYPLSTFEGKESPFIEPLRQQFEAQGYKTSIQIVRYEFQRGSNKMLKIKI
jgi:hypothetical protein